MSAELVDGGACVPGIYSRSEALVQATRDLARGRGDAGTVERVRRDDLARLLAVQRENGLSPLASGLLDWQDVFRPLVEASDGLATGPLVRFLDGNAFYRAVSVEGSPRLRAPLPGPGLADPWLATLPSPLAFAHAAGHAASPAVLAERVLAPQLEAWARDGCALVVLWEPFLAREPGRLHELLATLEQLPRPVPLALQLPFADASPLLPALAEAAINAIGVDFVATPPESLPLDYPQSVLAGVVDAASSLLERPEQLAALVKALRARRPAALALTPNGDLEHVPETIAHEKLRLLGAAAATLREAA